MNLFSLWIVSNKSEKRTLTTRVKIIIIINTSPENDVCLKIDLLIYRHGYRHMPRIGLYSYTHTHTLMHIDTHTYISKIVSNNIYICASLINFSKYHILTDDTLDWVTSVKCELSRETNDRIGRLINPTLLQNRSEIIIIFGLSSGYK